MQKELENLKQKYQTDFQTGLLDDQIETNRLRYGKNELEEKKKTNLFFRFFLEFKDPLMIVLMIAAILSILIDKKEWIESCMIMIVVFLNAILGVYQENKAEKSLEALKKMGALSCKVIRNNYFQTILAEELVVGDIIFVEAGDSIPADARVIESCNLKVEEAALTGESIAVDKSSDFIESEKMPLGERKNSLFSSTHVTYGKAKAIVVAVGMNTEIGKIANLLNKQKNSPTPLQEKLSKVGKAIGILTIGICLVVFLLEMMIVKWDFHQFNQAFITAVALSVAAIPEGLATVVTIVLSIGVRKMSKRNAVVKKLPSVETLGACNVICSDKTGTLTQNKMTVTQIYYKEIKEIHNLTIEEQQMIDYFAICCDAKIEKKDGEIVRIGDPTELAILDICNQENIKNVKRLFDLPFDSERKLMTTVIQKDNQYIAITKGAVDQVLTLSNHNEAKKKKFIEANQKMANAALRVLALGIKRFDTFPQEKELEQDLTCIGLIGMINPARIEVKEAIQQANKAGIKTIMITGDHIVTACAIAKELGILKENDKAISSSQFDELTDQYLEEHIHEFTVFARVSLHDKVRIVKAWQKQGAICAMTGDGVNDAPALKIADIGCAMGITGTDVAKEAADMILLDDNFSTIVSAVKEGRGIYQNIKKCIQYLLSSNIGEVITIFVATLLTALGVMDLKTPLSAIQLLWINLITDSLPAFGIGMEEAKEDIMKQKPRLKNESFLHMDLSLKYV